MNLKVLEYFIECVVGKGEVEDIFDYIKDNYILLDYTY